MDQEQPSEPSQDTEQSEYNVPVELPNGPDSKFAPAGWKPPRKTPKKLVLAVASLACIFAVVFIAWKVIGTRSTRPKATNQSTKTTNEKSVELTDVPDVTGTKTYKNDRIGVSLVYPISWSVTETEDNGVRIESSNFTYKTIGGQAGGIFRIYIRLGARPNDQKIIGRGLAVAASEKLTYTSPLPGQRTDTFLTAFGLDNTDNFGFFMIAGNFNLKKAESLGPTYGKEQDAFIIGGGYSTKNQTDDLAMTAVPLASYNQTKAYKQAIDILKSLQLR